VLCRHWKPYEEIEGNLRLFRNDVGGKSVFGLLVLQTSIDWLKSFGQTWHSALEKEVGYFYHFYFLN
jgi:hypothetical protein